jgi:hypothetical protein
MCLSSSSPLAWAKPIAAAQDHRGMLDERLASASDAFSLCSNAIPNGRKVESYLREQTSDLSDLCRSVFERSAAAADAGKYQDRIAAERF